MSANVNGDRIQNSEESILEFACNKYPGRYALCIKTHEGVTTCEQGCIYRIEHYEPTLTRRDKSLKAAEWFHMPPLSHPIHSHETIHGTGGYIRFTETEMQFTDVDSKNPFHKLADGTWVCSMKDNSGYEGQMSSETGKRHGEGVTTYANGDTYKGQYQNDKCHGIWTYISAGTILQVQWEHGTRTRTDLVIDLSEDDTPILPSPIKKARHE